MRRRAAAAYAAVVSTAEERFRATLEGAGARATGRDAYVLPQGGDGPRIFAVFARGKKSEFSNLTFVIPIRAEPGSAQPFGGALDRSSTSRASVSWLPPVKFFIEKESHRTAKSRGAIRELQSGVASFDDQVFVDSSARPGEVRELLAAHEFCDAVRGAFEADARYVELRGGAAAALVVWPNHATFTDPNAAEQVLASVTRLSATLPRFESTKRRLRLGPAGFLMYASVFGAATGFLGGLIATVRWGPVSGELGLHAACAAMGPYLVLLIAARFRARRSSSGTARFGVIAVCGLFGLVGWSLGLGHGLNALLDRTVKIHAAILEEKFEQRGSKKTHYYARLAPVGPVARSVDFKVDRSTYQSLPVSGAVRVRAGAGWLGYAWIDAVYPAK